MVLYFRLENNNNSSNDNNNKRRDSFIIETVLYLQDIYILLNLALYGGHSNLGRLWSALLL